MALYIPTWEEQKAAKQERAEIFDTIMNIQNPKLLSGVAGFAKGILRREIKDHPMSLDDFTDMLEPEMIVKMRELFKDESDEYMVNAQIKELLERSWATYTGIEPETKTA